jgi:hypothetical protein
MGRPRKFPQEATASDRVAASTSALIAAGGVRKTFRLSPKAHAALQLLMQEKDAPSTETALIERLLLTASKSLARN